MPRVPVTLVDANSTVSLVAFVFEDNFTIADIKTQKIVASTFQSTASVQLSKPKSTVRSVSFSRSGKYFAICFADKSIEIYDTKTWTLKRSLVSEKRTNDVCFDPKETHLVTADKFGDAYRTPVDGEDGFELLLGHVSILCALGFTYTEPSFILSCDRDEKLRISRYPNSYNIQAFGLGHVEFVTSVATTAKMPECAFTGAGDGTLRLWKVESGKLLDTIELAPLMQKYYQDGRAKVGENSFEDRTAAQERYGCLRVRAWDRVGAFVAVIERIPALLVIPFGNSDKLGDPVLVDLENAPTDVAVVNDTCVVSFNAPADKLFAIVRYNGEYEVDAQNDMLELVESPESENQITVPSIFVWGNKMYLERPQGEEE